MEMEKKGIVGGETNYSPLNYNGILSQPQYGNVQQTHPDFPSTNDIRSGTAVKCVETLDKPKH